MWKVMFKLEGVDRRLAVLQPKPEVMNHSSTYHA